MINAKGIMMNKRKNILKDKSKLFAIKIIELYKDLSERQREYVLSKQLLRSGTSVGAMVREAEYGQTKKDFIHKLSIAQKEINESIYWLELLFESDYISQSTFVEYSENAIEILKLLTSSIKTAKHSLTTKH